MVKKYGSKKDKALTAKGWAAKEGWSVWETERMMDIELFLEGLTKWEADSPHHLVMLYEMFQHTTDQEWKEVEWTVCQGCWQGLPKLDPEAEVSTIQLVGPQTTKEEIQSLYLEVYKQQTTRVLTQRTGADWGCGSFLWTLPRVERRGGIRKNSKALANWCMTPKEQNPWEGRREASVERSLAKLREAHQKALAMVAALEEEIEWLSCPLIVGATREPALERRCPKFLGWEKVLHLSWLMVAAGQIPHPSRGPRLREKRVVWIPQTESSRTTATPQKTPTPPKTSSPIQELEVIQPATPTSSFLGVTACLRRDESPERTHEVSPNPLAVGVMSAPGVATMSMSHILRDEVMGITYMDMVTTSVGWVALSGPEQETPTQGPTIEGITDPISWVAR